ncbi:quinone-dependent dihydroorotate dehydrogenase [Dermacoccaceae bacterium W4C1]
MKASTARSRLLGSGYRGLARPVLFRMHGGDAEAAHHATIERLAGLSQRNLRALAAWQAVPTQPVTIAGLTFANRVGLAAGVDKDGVALSAWPALGFGHVELGTVTGSAQPGNDAPRLFRLPKSRAIINRMGFNNAGSQALAQRLRAARAAEAAESGVGEQARVPTRIGVSIGKTKTVPVAEATEDYLTSVRALDGLADYLAVNVSSPNTPGLRGLQDREPLAELLAAITSEAAHLAARRGVDPVPVFVKVAPDLDDAALDDVLQVAEQTDVSGLIATNTTLARDGLATRDLPLAEEAGGLSGAPLTQRARYVVGRLVERGSLPVIGVGGVMSAADGVALLDAGAELVQIYSGFIYSGPALITDLLAATAERGSA